MDDTIESLSEEIEHLKAVLEIANTDRIKLHDILSKIGEHFSDVESFEDLPERIRQIFESLHYIRAYLQGVSEMDTEGLKSEGKFDLWLVILGLKVSAQTILDESFPQFPQENPHSKSANIDQ